MTSYQRGDEVEVNAGPDDWRAGVITGVLYLVQLPNGEAVALPPDDVRSAPRLPLEGV